MKHAIRFIAVLLIVAMLAIPASAAAFTPSVEQKGAPEVTGTDVQGIVVTPLAEAEEASAEVEALLEEACNSVVEAGSLEAAAPALKETLEALGSELAIEDLVVRDLFHVLLAEAMEKVTLIVDLGVEPGDLVIAMLFVDGEWVPVDPELVTVNKDGTVNVVFSGQSGVIAFVVEKSE